MKVLRLASPHPCLLPCLSPRRPYWGILGVLPSRISFLCASAPFLARKALRQCLSLRTSWSCRHLPKPHMIQMDLLSPQSAGRLPGAHFPLQPSHPLLLGSSKAL